MHDEESVHVPWELPEGSRCAIFRKTDAPTPVNVALNSEESGDESARQLLKMLRIKDSIHVSPTEGIRVVREGNGVPFWTWDRPPKWDKDDRVQLKCA